MTDEEKIAELEAKIAQMGAHPLLPFNLWVGGESGRGNFFSPDGGRSGPARRTPSGPANSRSRRRTPTPRTLDTTVAETTSPTGRATAENDRRHSGGALAGSRENGFGAVPRRDRQPDADRRRIAPPSANGHIDPASTTAGPGAARSMAGPFASHGSSGSQVKGNADVAE